MRDAAGRRRARAAPREVLPRRDDLPALRHRGGVPLSVRDGAARAPMVRVRAARGLLRHPVRRLRVRLAERGARLGPRAGMILAPAGGVRLTWMCAISSHSYVRL